MAEIKKIFAGGVLNTDDDERVLQNDYPYAENILIASDDNGNSGSAKNIYRNRKITDIYLGEDVNTITPNFCVDEKAQKLYWFTQSSYGCFILEHNLNNKTTSIILGDTRTGSNRVFDLKKDYLITGIEKIISGDESGDMLLWTDNNMQPCCINIERAKSWGINNFTKEDIFLIKKQPKNAPVCTPITILEKSNYLEERFVSICYRYKYRDGEYSATSSYSNYQFNPGPFQLDFITGENLGMVSKSNALLISFNTGEKQVVGIDILAKQSNSNSLYKIASFDKKMEGWGDNTQSSYTFSNNQIYSQLPEKELYRQYDNVPLKAKSLTLIGNRPVFGDYVEGRNIEKANGEKIKINYTVGLNAEEFVQEDFTLGKESFPVYNYFTISKLASEKLTKGKEFTLEFNSTAGVIYNGILTFTFPRDYTGFDDLISDENFKILINNYLTNDLIDNHTTVDPTWNYVSTTPFLIDSATQNKMLIHFPKMKFNDGGGAFNIKLLYASTSNSYLSGGSMKSLKSNRDLEVGIIYRDSFGRATTVLTCSTNSIYIPHENSVLRNRLVVSINNPPPAWADNYKIVVRQQPLSYNNIYVNEFYVDGVFRWIKLDGENKDKVKENDILILKADREGSYSNIVKTKVLEITEQEEDFIKDNVDVNGIEIVEPRGLYAKIKPTGFPMGYDPGEFNQSENYCSTQYNRPIVYLDLFSEEDSDNPGQFLDRKLYAGDRITLYLRNKEKKDGEAIYENIFTLNEDYDNFKDWFDVNIATINIVAENGDTFETLDVVRGSVTHNILGGEYWTSFVSSPTGKRYLKVEGIYAGNLKKRYSRFWSTITLRSGKGVFIFETEPKQVDNEIYYETEETFDIVNGNHVGTIQSQDVNNSIPAISEINFFNCYSQGNGAESYQVKDSILKSFLNVDLRPSAVQIEEYKQTRRFADLTYGEAFVESSGRNGVNEFNISTENYKELDKQHGSIQRLFSRESNLLVHQEGKTSQVLFGKDLISTAEGVPVVSVSPEILGQLIPYAGNNGIGKNPESAARDSYRTYFANQRRGTPMRLSMDGIEDINIKMVSHFRKSFSSNPSGVRIGAFDPYTRHYILSEKKETPVFTQSLPNEIFEVVNFSEPYIYLVQVNHLGNVKITYNITNGVANIKVTYKTIEQEALDVSGEGEISIPITSLGEDLVKVEITPVTTEASFQIINNVPQGKPLDITSFVIGDTSKRNVISRYRWNEDGFYSKNDMLINGAITRVEKGIEGENKFPTRGSKVDIQSLLSDKINIDTDIANDKSVRIGYLISEIDYSESDVNEILDLVTWVYTTRVGNTFGGEFIFNRNDNQKLYLLWDYVDRVPKAKDDLFYLDIGSTIECDVLSNDVLNTGTVQSVSIISSPTQGSAVVELDNTITYVHTSGIDTEDEFTYKYETQYGVSNNATVKLKFNG